MKEVNHFFQFNYWVCSKGERNGTIFAIFRRGAFGAANVDFFGPAPSAPLKSIFLRRGAVGAADVAFFLARRLRRRGSGPTQDPYQAEQLQQTQGRWNAAINYSTLVIISIQLLAPQEM